MDVQFARSHFPALDQGWALFDNAGGSVAPGSVIDRVHEYLCRYHVQLDATYPQSVAATEKVHAGIAAAATLIGADSDEVVIGPSTTMNVYVLAQALGTAMASGDEIIVTNLDHEANIGAWRALARHGVVVREWQFRPETMALHAEDMDALLNERTRLVCFTHCSNIVGQFHDVAALTRRIHQAGALVCVDGVAYAPHRAVDVKALDVDFYLLSLYKVYGPHLAVLYGKRAHLAAVANQNHFFLGADASAVKLEPGYVNHELTASVPGIVDYLTALDRHLHGADAQTAGWIARVFAAIAAHEERLVTPLIAYLRDRPDVDLLGPATGDAAVRAPTVAFTVHGRDASEIPVLLEQERIAVRFGDFYARRAVEALGLHRRNGVVRVSMVHYNSADEVARLIAALDRVLA